MRAQTQNNYRPTSSSALPTTLVVLMCLLVAAHADPCTSVTATGSFTTGTCATVTSSIAGQTINLQVTAETITSVTVVGPGDVTLIFANTNDVTSTAGDLVTVSGTAVGKLLVTFAGSWQLTNGHALNIDALPPTSLLGVYVNQGKSLVASSGGLKSIVNAPSMSIPQLIIEGNGAISATGTAFSIGTVTGNAGITMSAKLECTGDAINIPGGMTGSASISFGSQLAATLGGKLLSTASVASSTIIASGIISTTGTHIVSISGSLVGQATFNSISMYGGSVAQFSIGSWLPTALQFQSITTTAVGGSVSVAVSDFSTIGSNFVISTLSATNPIIVNGVSMVAGSVASAVGMNNFNIGALGSTVISFSGAFLSSTTALTSASSCFKIGTASGAQLLFYSASSNDRCTVKGMAVANFVSASTSLTFAAYHTTTQGSTTFSAQGSLFLANAGTVTIAARFPGTVNVGNTYGLLHLTTGSSHKLSIMSGSTITNSNNAYLITTTANSVAGLDVTMTHSSWAGLGLFAPTLVSLTGSSVVITGASSVAGTNVGSRMSFLGTSLSLTAFTTSTLTLNTTILFAKTTSVTGMSIGAVDGTTLSMTSMTMTASTTIGVGLSVGAGVSFTGRISGVTMDITQTGSAYNTNFAFGIMSNFQFTMTSVTLAATNYNVRFASMSAANTLSITSSKLTAYGSTATANLDISSGLPELFGMMISSVSFSSVGRSIAVGGVNTLVGKLDISDCNATVVPSSSVGADETSFLSLGSLSQSIVQITITNVALTISTSSALQTISGVYFPNNMNILNSAITVNGITFNGAGQFNTTGQAVVIGGTGTGGVGSSVLYVSNVLFNNISSESLIYQSPEATWTSVTMTVKCAEMRKVNYLVGSATPVPPPAARAFMAQAVSGKQQNPVFFSGTMTGTNVLMVDSILAVNVSTGSRGFVVSTTLTGTLAITYINNYFHVVPLVADSPAQISVLYGCSYMASLVLSNTHFQFTPSLSSLAGTATCTKPGAGCYDTPSLTLSNEITMSKSVTESPSVTESSTATVSSTGSVTVSETPSLTTSATVSLSVSPTASETLSVSVTASESVTQTLSATPSVTASLTPTVSVTPTMTVSLTPTASLTPTTSVTPSVSVTPTISHTPSLTVTPTLTESTTPTLTQSPTTSITPTPTMTLSPTVSLTPTHSVTPSVTTTPSRTATVTPTVTVTPTITATPTASATVTATDTRTLTNSHSMSPSRTLTPSHSESLNVTVTATHTASQSGSSSRTPTASATSTDNGTDTASLTPSLTSITRKPTATNTFQVNLTDPLMSTRIRVVFNGTKWNVIVVNFPRQLELALRQSIAARLGMPLANINIIDYRVGSLIVTFEVTRNRTFAISDSGLLVELSYNVAYNQAFSLYFNETGETAQIAEPIVVNPTSLADEQPQAVMIAVIAGVVGLVLVIAGAVAVWWKFCRNADTTTSTNEPHAQPQADPAPEQDMQEMAAVPQSQA